MENITRNTYICALHWPGEKRPTEEFPDPLKANFTKKEKEKASSRKRRNPVARSRTLPGAVPQKRQKLISRGGSRPVYKVCTNLSEFFPKIFLRVYIVKCK